MPVTFKIQLTKQIIAACKEVGVLDDVDIIGGKCPVKVAIANLFPDAHVSNLYIFPFGMDSEVKIELPQITKNFINLFDSLSRMPRIRLLIPAFEFDIEIPDSIIDSFSIEDLKDCLEENKIYSC